MTSSRDEEPRWWAALMSRKYEQQWVVVQQSWCDEQRRWAALICQIFLDGYMSLLYCKCKLVLLLRLGYLRLFLAGSKKTRQGPRYIVGALCISRCWFFLTVVAGPKIIQKDYKIILCCVLLCCVMFFCVMVIDELNAMWMMMFMKWLW